MSVPYTTPQRAGHAPASSQQDFALPSYSVPFSMGHSQSKPVPPLPSANPSTATKGFNAAVAGGMKLKRALAGRRKKSEDASSVFAKREVGDTSSPSSRIEPSVFAPPQFLDRGNVVSPPSPPPPIPLKNELTLPPPTEVLSAGSRNSAISISPGISSAVNYISLMDQQKQEENPNSKREQKETWRKSDSTNSHHTIRPGGGVSKSSRPVSWAESFQSTHTVVQTSNRRLSALIADADFGMPEAAEEDDDDDSHNPPSHPTETYSPPASRNRRSMSLNIPIGMQSTQPLPSPPPTIVSAPATDLKYPSYSISEGFAPHRHAPPMAPSASQPQPSTQQQNVRARFTGNPYISPPFSTAGSQPEKSWTAAPLLHQPYHPLSTFSSPSPPISSAPSTSTSNRQTTISIASGGIGIGPAAAGLAKRAVEKMSMGRKWAMGMGMNSSGSGASGSGYSSSASASSSSYFSTGGPSSFTSAHTDHGLVRTESASSVHKHRRTPGSGTTSASTGGSISSSSITSSSDASSSDPFAQTSGPVLGRKLRGALLTKNGVKLGKGGVVFGRSLGAAVGDTGVYVGKPPGKREGGPEGLVRELEERSLPAVAVRCAQHILLWGVQEEGLFRVSGRPMHVSKLRAEFDSGADYDMTESSPGDLDPHAVASVFKAYLRELPEPILTHKLSSLFDAAVNKESTINAESLFGGGGSGSTRLGARPGLPTSPKSGFAIRKPPSLSTLAMPSFTAIPPPSPVLILSIRSLILQLPQENRDLLKTVVELIRATSGRSRETKMPLSNLLLVFCPSLNMTPPLLKVLCEAEGIWDGEYHEKEVEEEMETGPFIDIRRQTMPARSSPAADRGEFFVDETKTTTPSTRSAFGEERSDSVRSGRTSLDTTNNNPSSDYHGSAEEESIYDDENDMLSEPAPRRRIQRGGAAVVERRKEVPTVYLDCSSSSASSLIAPEDLAGSLEVSGPYLHHHSRQPAGGDSGSMSSGNYSMHAPSPPPLLSSSPESVDTPTSSGNPSYCHLPLEHERHQAKEEKDQLENHQIHAHDHQHQRHLSHSQHQRHGGRGPEIVDATPPELRAPSKRPVISCPIPITEPVRFPSSTPPPSTPQQLIGNAVSALKRRSIPMLSLPSFSSSQPQQQQQSTAKVDSLSPGPSPMGSQRSLSAGSENVKSLHRSKKPSLKLLFSKRSTSSLTGARDRSGSIGGGMSFLSLPKNQGSPKQEMKFQTPPRSVSDSSSSVSTPLSVVTAPQSQCASGSGSAGSLVTSSPSSRRPPVLDTPIEGSSFGFDLVFKPTNGSTKVSTSPNLRSQAPNNSSSRSQQSGGSKPPLSQPANHPLSVMQRRGAEPGENQFRPHASTSNLSISSMASSNHLSLFEDDDEEEVEDWTQSVLLAADVEGKNGTIRKSSSPS